MSHKIVSSREGWKPNPKNRMKGIRGIKQMMQQATSIVELNQLRNQLLKTDASERTQRKCVRATEKRMKELQEQK